MGKETDDHLQSINECPDCASQNIVHSATRDQVICKECGLVFEPFTPVERPAAARAYVAPARKAKPAKARAKKAKPKKRAKPKRAKAKPKPKKAKARKARAKPAKKAKKKPAKKKWGWW